MKPEPTVDELTLLAFVYAEQWCEGVADSWGEGTPEAAEAIKEKRRFQKYRTKRWGRTKLEAILQDPSLRPINLDEMKRLHREGKV